MRKVQPQNLAEVPGYSQKLLKKLQTKTTVVFSEREAEEFLEESDDDTETEMVVGKSMNIRDVDVDFNDDDEAAHNNTRFSLEGFHTSKETKKMMPVYDDDNLHWVLMKFTI